MQVCDSFSLVASVKLTPCCRDLSEDCLNSDLDKKKKLRFNLAVNVILLRRVHGHVGQGTPVFMEVSWSCTVR